MYEKASVKHESQRRVRSDDVPARSELSSTVVQKQVGQAIVQLPHDRHRVAISSQRGWSAWRGSHSAIPSGSSERPIDASATAIRRSASPISSGPAGVDGTSVRRSAPFGVPASATYRGASSPISVRATSKPRLALGPAPTEAQKQVPAGAVHETATMRRSRRTAA